MIPRTIHQIWIGDQELPPMLKTWPDLYPHWEYRLWRDDDLAQLEMTNRVVYDDLYRQRLWSGAADVARAEILNGFGGVYIDADTVALHPLDDAPFMESSFWITEEQRDPQPFLLNCAIVGSERRSKPISDVVTALGDVDPSPRNYSETWAVTGPTRWTRVLRGRDDVTIVPPGAFFEHTVYNEPIPYDGIRYGAHEFGRTYDRPDITVVIPFGDTGSEHRLRNLRWLEIYWQHHLTIAEFIVEPFQQLSKTFTLNRGIEKASGSTIVAMDADTLSDPQQMYKAIDIAKEGGWCIPYEHMYRLDMRDTEKVLAEDPWKFQPAAQIAPKLVSEQMSAHRFGAMIQIFPKAAWERIGGFDERFRGWGCEDEAMLITFDTLWSDHHLLPGNIFHLEHTRIGKNENGVGNGWRRRWSGQETESPNIDLRNEYAYAAGDKLALERVLSGRS